MPGAVVSHTGHGFTPYPWHVHTSFTRTRLTHQCVVGMPGAVVSHTGSWEPAKNTSGGRRGRDGGRCVEGAE